MKYFDRETIETLPKQYRTNLINSLPGVRQASMIGTINLETKVTNLAIFSSVFHVGANPPMMGFVMRPFVDESRHTYANIKQNGYFTINHVGIEDLNKAHQTSARYDGNQSEFDFCGFQQEFSENFPAPFIKDSSVQIGLKFIEEHILINRCIIIIGEVIELNINESIISPDGNIIHQTLTVGNLDTYYEVNTIATLPYAKVQ